MAEGWHTVDIPYPRKRRGSIRYSPSLDSIEVVDPDDGQVTTTIPRNVVLRMVGMLPSSPPARDVEQEGEG